MGKKKQREQFDDPYTVMDAINKGGISTKLSMVVMGFGNICHKQWIKGLLFLLVEVAFFIFMALSGASNISLLGTLGDNAGGKVYNESLGIYEYTQGDNSLLILLYGIASLFLVVGFILAWRAAVKSAYKAECLDKTGKHVNSFADDLRAMFNENLHKTLLTFPVAGILVFNVLPLVFMISMAFTNYSKDGNHLTLFDWVGLTNFAKVLNFGDSIGQQFWSVLGWTLIWAVCTTFLCYILGMILAIVINRDGTRIKSFWRFCFVLSIAIPQFVSLLVVRTMFKDTGFFNTLLMQLGWITKPLPFLTDANWARVTVIIANLWVGIPYTMLTVTGILQNIPAELYEAARVDGANAVTIFFKITLPYMLFVTAPSLITAFTTNVNNFNVIYLLTAGAPTPVGATAGKTDLLVTWLYKLTIDQQYYNIGAVIGILTFVVLAIVSLVAYRSTGSYKNEEGFQ